jgi:hypothetical protein
VCRCVRICDDTSWRRDRVYDSGASRVMTTEAVTALASAAVITIDNNYARRWNTIGCEE